MSDQELRIGDADREQAAAALGEHYAQGRITTEEHRERLDQIWAARTRPELGRAFADLPGPGFRAPAPTTTGPRPAATGRPIWRRVPPPLLALFAILAAVAVVTHLPLILIGVGIWFFLSRGSCGSRMHHRW